MPENDQSDSALKQGSPLDTEENDIVLDSVDPLDKTQLIIAYGDLARRIELLEYALQKKKQRCSELNQEAMYWRKRFNVLQKINDKRRNLHDFIKLDD